MPRSKQPETNYQELYFKGLEGDISEIKTTVKDILTQTQKTNGRVTKSERDIEDLKLIVNKVPEKKDLPQPLRDPKFLRAIYYFSLTLLLAVASFTGFDIAGLLK